MMTSSLRRRIRLWVILTTTITVGLVTAASAAWDRQRMRRAESAYVSGFLEHLAAMPELRVDSGSVRAHLAALEESFTRAGGRVALVRAGSTAAAPLGSGAVACEPLSLPDGEWVLHYWSDGRFIRSQRRQSLAIHASLAVVTVLGLVVGVDRILRRSLLEPLSVISRQLERITEGGGWLASVPETDVELARLSKALRALGPGLEAQMREWIETERRCAAAAVLAGLRDAALEPLRSAHLELSRLEAGLGDRSADSKRRLRRAARDVEQLSAALDGSAERWFPPGRPSGARASRTPPAPGA